MPEECLLTGPLEPTNESYALAKIAGIKLCESYNNQHENDFRSIIPTNLYGPGDNFHETNSHVVPALLRRFHDAKIAGDKRVTIWGTGKPLREFMHVYDMAEACVFVMNLDRGTWRKHTTPRMSHLNVGSGEEFSILDLAHAVARTVGFKGEIAFDPSKPDGAPRKLLDVTKINSMGWCSSISLADGLTDTYRWFLDHQGDYPRD